MISFNLLQLSTSILLLFFAVQAMIYLSVYPHEFPYLAIWMPVSTLTVTDVISKLPFIDLSVCPCKFAPTIFDVFEILTFKYISIITFPKSFSLSLAFHKLTLVNTSIFPFVNTNSTELSILKLASVYIAIYQFLETIAMFEILFDFSLVVKTIFGQNNGFSSFLSHFEIPDILSIFLVNVFAKSVGFSVRPFSIIGHKIIGIVSFCGKYLDGSLTMSHSIFKIAQVNVFVWNILKTKAVLLAFSWQIYFPVSEIKGTTIVPNDIFTCIQLKVQAVLELSSYDLLFLSLYFYSKQLKYLRTQFLVIFKALSHFGWVQRKPFGNLQLLHYFLSEILLYFGDLPFWHELFLENDSTVWLQLNFLLLLNSFLGILLIFSCFCLCFIQLYQIISLTLNFIYHSFIQIFLFDSVVRYRFGYCILFSFTLTSHRCALKSVLSDFLRISTLQFEGVVLVNFWLPLIVC